MEAFFKEILEGTSSVDVLSTSLGTVMKKGTDPSLDGPDWGWNMEVVDNINAGGKEACVEGFKAISALLKQVGDEGQVDGEKRVYLTLILLETCMKNCGPAFAQQISAAFMQEIISLARGCTGKRNADEAARLIQQWGHEYEKDRSQQPLFFDTYVALKAKGVTFPADDEEIRGRGRSSLSGGLDDSQSPPPRATPSKPLVDPRVRLTNQGEFERLELDLATVDDKVKLCQDMLLESPGIPSDELLAEIVGFLEACRDRLSEVVDAGTHGVLSEELLSRCLKVNDAVVKTLEAERTGLGKAPTPPPPQPPQQKQRQGEGGDISSPSLSEDAEEKRDELCAPPLPPPPPSNQHQHQLQQNLQSQEEEEEETKA